MFPRLICRDEAKVNCEDVSFTDGVVFACLADYAAAVRWKDGAAVSRVLITP